MEQQKKKNRLKVCSLNLSESLSEVLLGVKDEAEVCAGAHPGHRSVCAMSRDLLVTLKDLSVHLTLLWSTLVT